MGEGWDPKRESEIFIPFGMKQLVISFQPVTESVKAPRAVGVHVPAIDVSRLDLINYVITPSARVFRHPKKIVEID